MLYEKKFIFLIKKIIEKLFKNYSKKWRGLGPRLCFLSQRLVDFRQCGAFGELCREIGNLCQGLILTSGGFSNQGLLAIQGGC